ncbi:LRRCT domain-containing protein [Caerostris extrusa]|uniref:LRRCT domain-containing protein n=1 Tax=Caerostris extrusa TaxID=172846 RepID=A0AAV4PBD3_CAEEX|nr:LRRCT domain-containing protein [Caerostris extrusa]
MLRWPHPHLVCQNIDDTEVLRDIFIRSSAYWYKENTTLVELFDETPESLQMIEVLHIENTEVFSALVSKTLQQLTFFGTGTELVKPGVFGGYNKLNKVALDDCGITQLTRKIFPRPFNGRVLYFNYNKLTSIPDDLFADMPRLQTVGLRENQLSTIPAPAFEGSTSKLEFLMLEGNPIICDCRIMWLVRSKFSGVSGVCDSPRPLEGKEIKTLTARDMMCPEP